MITPLVGGTWFSFLPGTLSLAGRCRLQEGPASAALGIRAVHGALGGAISPNHFTISMYREPECVIHKVWDKNCEGSGLKKRAWSLNLDLNLGRNLLRSMPEVSVRIPAALLRSALFCVCACYTCHVPGARFHHILIRFLWCVIVKMEPGNCRRKFLSKKNIYPTATLLLPLLENWCPYQLAQLARLRGGPRVPVFGSVSAVVESNAGFAVEKRI